MIHSTSFFVYVLINPHDDIYIGHTNDLARRIEQHNDPLFYGTFHTKRHAGPWHVIHTEEFVTRAKAMCHEKQLKSSRGRAWIRQQLVAVLHRNGGNLIPARGTPVIDNRN